MEIDGNVTILWGIKLIARKPAHSSTLNSREAIRCHVSKWHIGKNYNILPNPSKERHKNSEVTSAGVTITYFQYEDSDEKCTTVVVHSNVWQIWSSSKLALMDIKMMKICLRAYARSSKNVLKNSPTNVRNTFSSRCTSTICVISTSISSIDPAGNEITGTDSSQRLYEQRDIYYEWRI